MSEQAREHLSALMDGELSRDATRFLLRRCDHDAGLLASWSRFQLASQALRRQAHDPATGFAEAVWARIEAESVVQRSRTGTWLRWASGGAIAASVAVAALVLSSPAEGPGTPGAASMAANSVDAPGNRASLNSGSEFRPPMLAPPLEVQTAAASTPGFANTAPIDPRLQSYLIRHYDATGNGAQPGVMPYVLLVVPPQQANEATTTGQR